MKVQLAGLEKGSYALKISKVGYKVNDAYTDYLAMGKPSQLSKQQVNVLKEKNNGDPVFTEILTIDSDGKYNKDFQIKENDVVLVNLIKL